MKKIFIVAVILLATFNQAFSQCACCAGAGSALNTDNNNGAFTLKKKKLSIEAYGDYRTIMVDEEGGDHGAPAGVDSTVEEETPLKSMLINSFGIRYGITDKITISALLPYVILNTDKGSDNGLGDLILLSTFNLYQKRNFNLALSAGVEFPTGVKKGSSFDETTVVVGSGSFDPILSLAASKKWNKLTLMGSALHRYTTKGFDNTTYSSVSLQNLLVSYNIKGHGTSCQSDSVCVKHNCNWSVSAGYYGEWLGQIQEEDKVDENSGYYLGFATLGTNLSFKKWSIPLTFSYPVFQHVNGDQNNAGLRFRMGIIKMF
ncbi:MAG: transporter [Bacteroidetes bacterium]|nr:transporter [Bacteroidota bacterium]